MNYASDATGMFIYGNVHIKMLKLFKVFKEILISFTQDLLRFSG